MHRQPLLNLLANHQASDPHEAKMLAEMIEFVKQNPDCFKRELLIGHVTGSAWIVDKSRKFVLLTHHRKLDKWLQPGGHCDGDPDVLNVALKEANEETGVERIKPVSESIFDVDIHLIPERKGIPAHYHYDVRFLLEADKEIPLVISDESNDLAWIAIEELPKLNDEESILRMVRKTL
ncbi:MAG: NUDIX hydrolase [Spirosomaceae bacterium]|jgi:8-oxo-dGTP pyrophosphatase MutT (NUDIX family)|nr:NUDIX hydrolase [Spirosomataceae bacterium]